MTPTVLIVDDEKNILLTLGQSLQLAGYKTLLASTAQVAFDLISAKPVDAVLMDVKMPDVDGLAALERLAQSSPRLPVIMMSGHGTIDTAVKATQLGARDFLEKPISRERVLVALRNCLQHQALVDELNQLRGESGEYQMVGRSAAMQRVYELIRKAAPSEGRVLITGENGTGKELIARAIHDHSKRRQNPFVKLNCAAVPHDLIESELFGHERGAFTGAVNVRRGKFELAHEGTIFLDEIGDMPSAMQAKVLRVLQEGELERVGGAETIKVDVRVIAATNRDLPKEIADGRFREDLYYRLSVVPIHAPPLRQRLEDIPDLIRRFAAEICAKNDRKLLEFAPEAVAALTTYAFPGNVRELRNWVERMAILCDGSSVSRAQVEALFPGAKALFAAPAHRGAGADSSASGAITPAVGAAGVEPPSSGAPPSGFAPGSFGEGTDPPSTSAPASVASGWAPRVDKAFRDQVEDAEREIVLHALAHTGDNVTEAARLLDLERGHFYKKMKALGIRRGAGDKNPP